MFIIKTSYISVKIEAISFLYGEIELFFLFLNRCSSLLAYI